MKRGLNLLFFIAAFFLFNSSAAYCVNDENFFDLFAIAETILSSQPKTPSSEDEQVRNLFADTTQKFNQGNVIAAYDEYSKLIPKLKNDFATINFAKFLYKNGLFSLAEVAISKLKHVDKLQLEIEDLKKSYGTNYVLNKSEEVFLAKLLSSIHFDNSALEVTYELNKNSDILEKSDYANYVMAQAFYELKRYPQALSYIKNALSLNPDNINYSYYKAKILIANTNYAQALKIAERSDFRGLNFKLEFMALKNNILSLSEKKQSDRKYYAALAAYYESNYYKAITNARSAISLDKKNYNAINLLAKSQLKIKEVDSAKYNFEFSNSVKKSNPDALIGLGDIEFIHSNFDAANTYYKKAYSKNKKNSELLLKLALVNEILGDKKASVKYVAAAKPTKNALYFENFEITTTLLNNITIAPKDANFQTSSRHQSDNLRNEYLKVVLAENPFFVNAWLELVNSGTLSSYAKDSFIKIAALSGEFNYFYYYNLALYEYSQKNYEKTLEYLNTSSALNPQFEPASRMLLNFELK